MMVIDSHLRGPRAGVMFKRLLLLAVGTILLSTRPASAAPTRLQNGDVDGKPVWLLDSCVGLKPTTNVGGILIVTADIICEEDKVIRTAEDLLIVSDQPVLATKGVRFHVVPRTTMRFGAASMLFERKKGDTREIFVVEPEAYLGWDADDVFPMQELGTEDDVSSIVRVKEGGTFDPEGNKVRYTDSSITVSMRPYTKDPSWMMAHRRWDERQRSREQTGGASYAGDPAAHEPLWTPFTPHASAKYSFRDRLGLSPSYLKVGEELRFPSTMTSSVDGSVMGLSADGSIWLSGKRREEGQDEEVKMSTLVAADVSKATAALMSRHRVDEDGPLVSNMKNIVDRDEEAVAAEAAAYRGVRDRLQAHLALMHEVLDAEDDETREALKPRPTPGNRTNKSPAESRLEKPDVNAPDGHRREWEEFFGDNANIRGHWGDDVVFTLTDKGSLVVTVAGQVVIEKHGPEKTKWGWVKSKMNKVNPFRRRPRKSTQYTLHVVASGLEVRLEGKPMWAWNIAAS